MFENKYPLFKKGSVLLKKDLDLLRDNSLEILNLTYFGKKDGIIEGFELITDLKAKEVTVTRGIVKYAGELYWMKEDYTFEMPKVENRYILKVSLKNYFKDRKSFVKRGEFLVESGREVKENEMEIARFITREGAQLRNDYQNFHDLKRDFNLLEIVNVKYSSYHELGTFHPMVTKLWGIDAAKKENLDIFDINFCTACLQGKVEREVIISYINIKQDLRRGDYTNEELYTYLLKILEGLGKEKERIEKKKIAPRRITID